MTLDEFLGGAVRAWQPRQGFRAGIDTVLLAAAVPATGGNRVLELGCGAGIASLCLGRRVGGIFLSGLEIQEFYAGLARRNARINRIRSEIILGCVVNPPEAVAAGRFDHVMANPPYYPAGSAVPPRDPGRAAAVIERAPLAAWIELAFRVLRPRGCLTMVLPAHRQAGIMPELASAAGRIQIKPLLPQIGRAASRILLRAEAGRGAEIEERPPLILHEGPDSSGVGNPYTRETERILRRGAAIEF